MSDRLIDGYINDYMKVNDKEPSTVDSCFSVLWSNDDSEWTPCDHSTSFYDEALMWFEEAKKKYTYVELTCQVVGIWSEEVENLGEVLIARYEKVKLDI